MPRLRLLGEPQIEETGTDRTLPLGKPFALLAYLSVREKPQSRDHLREIFWWNVAPENGRQSLRQALWTIRKSLGDGVFSSVDPVSVDPSFLSSDVGDFRRSLAEGRISDARALRTGAFLEDFAITSARPFKIWAEETREELDRLYGLALQASAAGLLDQGMVHEAAELCAEGLSIFSHSLELHRTHLESLLGQGDIPSTRRALIQAERELADLPSARSLLDDVRTRLEALPLAFPSDREDGYGFHVEFVGRTREFSLLLKEVRRSQKGESRVVGISGVPGIGKTRLAMETLQASAGGGSQAVRVKCHKAEKTLSWGVLGELVGELIRLPGSAGVSAVTDRALSNLTLTHPANGSGEGGLPRSEPTVYAEALLDLIRAVAFEGPVAALIDDVQWMDSESRAVLARVTRKLETDGVLILLTTRDPLSLGDLLQVGGELMEIGPLTPPEVLELVRFAVLIQPEGKAEEVGDRIVEASMGNPLFVGELLRQMSDTGIVRNTEEGWTLDANQLPPNLSLPDSVGDLIAQRLSQLPAESLRVCSALAGGSGEVYPEELRSSLGMAPEVFLRTVSELVVRGVLEWVGPDRLDFAHDFLREQVRSQSPEGGNSRRRRRLFGWAVPVVVAAGLAGFFLRGNAPPTLYETFDAQGTLFAFSEELPLREVVWPMPGDSLLGLHLSKVQPPTLPQGESQVMGIRRSIGGGLEWFQSAWTLNSPPDAVVSDSSGWKYLLRAPGDDHAMSVSPDGRFVVLSQELEDTDEYSVQTLLWDRKSTEMDTLASGHGPLPGYGDWSPDGRSYAFVLPNQRDSVFVVEPGRGVAQRLGFDEMQRLLDVRWCREEFLLLLGQVDGLPGLAEASLEGTPLRPIDLPFLPRSVSDCLPGGRHVVVSGADPDGFLMGLVEIDSARVLNIGRHEGITRRLFWVPDAPRILPVELEVAGEDPLRVDWGSFSQLSARLLMNDQSSVAVAPTWRALSPHIASVSARGVLAAVRPGTARIIAEQDWMADTLVAIVSSDHPPTLVLAEPFDSTWTERWSGFGYPSPTTVHLPSGDVLSLNGDGSQRDGMATRATFHSELGLTLDLEFRILALTRRERQRFEVCLAEAREPLTASGPWPTNGVCFLYPGDELNHFDPGAARLFFSSVRVGALLDVRPFLPSQDWVSLRMEVQSDGKVLVFLNGTLVAAPNLSVRPGSADWRVALRGASLDTQVLVRGINLWEGLTAVEGTR